LSCKVIFHNEIKDISSSNSSFLQLQKTRFSKNIRDNQIQTTTTVDGLSETISSLYYSNTFKKTLIGYESGLMIVVDAILEKSKNVVDIINKQLSPRVKRINHFMENKGLVYVSCDFGIVQFNLQTLLFGDTYFIGDNGAEIIVNQTAFSMALSMLLQMPEFVELILTTVILMILMGR
jgi:hypothetical protein